MLHETTPPEDGPSQHTARATSGPVPLSDATICIVGLGLMGGSLALALQGKVGAIVGADHDPGVVQAALEAGVIEGRAAMEENAGLSRLGIEAVGLTPARAEQPLRPDIVVLAVPAQAILHLIPRLSLQPGTLLLDLGSTKEIICRAMEALPAGVLAVGGHPICGRAEGGLANALPDLYLGAPFVLCPTTRTTPRARALAEGLVTAAGAHPLWIDAARHDRLTALTSHLPHLLAFALMAQALAAAEEDEALWTLAAGGFAGATRLARSDAAMVAGLLHTNRHALREKWIRFQRQCAALDAALDDPAALERMLQPLVEARREL
ncbi:MAG: prephenate dehydrogenase [Candidatus Promineifilaceae bacterium]|nr:prephenate dehydrogenase [Candidatus Promineifilaceae bacterium]